MAVHHFVAADIMVGWRTLDSFPRDGSTVEVCDVEGYVAKAIWSSEDSCIMLVDNDDELEALGELTHWRIPKEEG